MRFMAIDLGRLPAEALRPATSAEWLPPMLASPFDTPFSDPNWLFERKLDGVRAVVTADPDLLDGCPQLWSRNHRPMDDTYPELVDELANRGPRRFVADGEIVAFVADRTSFTRLQARIHVSDPSAVLRATVPVYLYLFDLLVLGDVDIRLLPLRDRKRLLREAFQFGGPLRYCTHRVGDGENYFRQACQRGWEGLIAKRADSRYVSGRSPNWLKLKCVREQEFVIGGFTEPQGSRIGFGALLLGYHDDRGALRYAGKVGSGYSQALLRALRARLDGLRQPASPFVDPVNEKRPHWVRPELVAQCGFTEWTVDGRLRHPRFLGLRTDKAAAEVVRESGA